MKKIGFSGTLDPITNGHMWVIREARALADEVVVLVSENPLKRPKFSAEKRKAIVEQSVAEKGWDNVSVVLVKGDYTARAAKQRGIDYLIRGIRSTADFDYENLLQQANVDVLEGSNTLFVMPPRDLGAVSSSFVKALQGPVGWHWNMRKFVPGPAYRAWILDWLRSEWDSLWDERTDERNRWFERLCAAYAGIARHYHDLDHLVHGLTELGVWAANTNPSAEDVRTLKKAFWFHDAVYGDAHEKESDEDASMRLWRDSGLGSAEREEVAELIRATDYFRAPQVSHRLQDVMRGADLAVLGQSATAYERYTEGVRAEHARMNDAAYRENRRRILLHLQQMAATGGLYKEPHFAERYNDAAQRNIRRELQATEAMREAIAQ